VTACDNAGRKAATVVPKEESQLVGMLGGISRNGGLSCEAKNEKFPDKGHGGVNAKVLVGMIGGQ
jgi:hypothetical protein